MKIKNILFIVYLFLMINNCWSQQKLKPIKAPAITYRNRLPVKVKDCWQHLDIEKDTIAGTSLKRAYQDIIKKEKGKTLIVAVIDGDIDIHHEDLKQAIWINKKEIPNNGKDDDHNGYIDDINGWNFLGNPKGGDDVVYANTESTRILKSLQKQYASYPNFKGNKTDSIKYLKATDRYKKDKQEIDSAKSYASQHMAIYRKGLVALEKNFHRTQFNMSEYDSLYKKNKDGDSVLVDHILYMRDYYRLGKNYETLKKDSIKVVDQYRNTYNEAYYDRAIIGDNEYDIKDTHYGNNNIYKNAVRDYHGTIVAGAIAANRANKIGVEGFGDQIKIMPITAIPNGGSEHDKDVSLAIHYAVDNGAKVINMSFGKTSSMHLDWIKEAFLYAQKHDVLLIAGAGNDMQDSDIYPFYPIDYDIASGQEYCNNFIKVGAISLRVNTAFLADFTNYGKKTVDTFAPGYFLKTTYPENKYAYRDGTSMATPVVSGVAALVRSYYPKLTASQVKQIILDSGVAYDNLQVQVPGEKDGVLKPFSEMSKSGKVVNAYNALLMAGEVSKKAKGNRQKAKVNRQ
jgi:cell wall-associated protease